MNTKQFIQDAIEGGYESGFKTNIGTYDGKPYNVKLEKVLLDPKAWQAVGKVRGWYPETKLRTEDGISGAPQWKVEWRYFIDHLADGKTTEEALKKLL